MGPSSTLSKFCERLTLHYIRFHSTKTPINIDIYYFPLQLKFEIILNTLLQVKTSSFA